jgi:hypothetical protein
MSGKAISLRQIRELLCKRCLAAVERPGDARWMRYARTASLKFTSLRKPTSRTDMNYFCEFPIFPDLHPGGEKECGQPACAKQRPLVLRAARGRG